LKIVRSHKKLYLNEVVRKLTGQTPCMYYLYHQYRNKSKSQLTSPMPAQLPAVVVSLGHIVYAAKAACSYKHADYVWHYSEVRADIEHIIFFLYNIISYDLPKKRYNIIYIISWIKWYDSISYIIFLSFQKKIVPNIQKGEVPIT
jgi:hypothetical protein